MILISRDSRGLFSALGPLCAALLLVACAASSYAGIPLAAGAADPELQALARRAQGGDKQAQLELGIRYEEGRGAPVDIERAERLYRMAASDTGGTRMAYIPSAGSSRVSAVPLSMGSRAPGLPAARERLRSLRARNEDRAKAGGRSSNFFLEPHFGSARRSR